MGMPILLLLLCFHAAISVHGQLQTGFISIDCGSPVNFNFVDIDTGISYASDVAYIEAGVNQNISSQYSYPNNPNLPQPLSDVRSFPRGNKNCYTLTTSAGKGGLNLIRASFMYGNYDGENKLPEFDLYLDVNLWSKVKFRNASDVVTPEIISVASSDTLHICLVNKGLGIPFISALELRPLNGSIYNTEAGSSASDSLVLYERLNLGTTNGSGRYKNDLYDRIWSPYSSPYWRKVSTTLEINVGENGYNAPQEVVQTAVEPQNTSEALELYWTADDVDSHFYAYIYFAEVELIQRNQSRKFDVSWNGYPLSVNFTPRYLYATIMSNSRAFVGKEHRISISKTSDSTLPPIINAIEIYIVKQRDETPTFGGDVDAVMDVKTTYRVNKNWVGDPCGPKNYSWEGLKCNYNGSLPPRIISLNLNSSGLSGTITASIAKISALETLDLSNNNLTGPVPSFLSELKSLKFLNLKGNKLSGSVPASLADRAKEGLLTLSVDDHNVCSSDSCKRNKKVIVPIVASISLAVALLIVLGIVWKLRRKRKEGTENKNGGKSLASMQQQFTYAEILSITNNFQTIVGKGGFGTVYHGHLENDTEVAVKMLSSSSSQGPKEFQTEAELLMRVHHRNLASFIGYCEEGDHMALIYEYMANGNLKNYMSDSRSCSLTWAMRLRIAVDAAQGLEYLHHGCKPPIIHRDVKTANILLSKNLDAKISDLGISKVVTSESHDVVMTQVMGTTGYLDPEYYHSQKLNEKSDVYSFGVVLLELVTGQGAIIKSTERIHIVHWVSAELEKGEISEVVDKNLHENYDVSSVWKALEVAMACTAPTSTGRASMSFVLEELKQCLAMELSQRRERSMGSREEMCYIKPYCSSPEVFSMDIDSMTSPSPR